MWSGPRWPKSPLLMTSLTKNPHPPPTKIFLLMTSLTKNPHPHPNKKFFFECRLEYLLSLLTFWTILYPDWRPSYALAKPHTIRLFWRENPRKRPEAKVLIQMRKSTHTWSYIFAQIFSYFVTTGSFKTWFSMKSQFLWKRLAPISK